MQFFILIEIEISTALGPVRNRKIRRGTAQKKSKQTDREVRREIEVEIQKERKRKRDKEKRDSGRGGEWSDGRGQRDGEGQIDRERQREIIASIIIAT